MRLARTSLLSGLRGSRRPVALVAAASEIAPGVGMVGITADVRGERRYWAEVVARSDDRWYLAIGDLPDSRPATITPSQ